MSEDSSVERLQKKLYSREGAPAPRERRNLQEDQVDPVSESWVSQEDIQEQQDLENDPEKMLRKLREGKMGVDQTPKILSDERAKAPAGQIREERRVAARLIRTLFTASATFFLLAVCVAGYFWYVGIGQVSCENVDIIIGGPLTIPSGKELVLSVGITNNNSVAMLATDLFVDYPSGTRSPENTSFMLPSIQKEIGTLKSGELTHTTVRAVLFGKEHTEQTVKVVVGYHIEDSDAEITCEALYPILMATAPVNLTVDGLEEISSGQELVLTINLTSNSDEIVPDMRVVADYPFGFQFVKATPAPTNNSNVWDLGDIAEGSQHTIVITGVVTAQSAEIRSVKVQAGNKDNVDAERLATILQFVDHPLNITRPFLTLSVKLNGSTASEISTIVGESVKGTVAFINTLPYPIYDVEIESKLPFTMIDIGSVRANGGFFRSVDQTMLWTKQTSKQLEVLEPGAKGSVSFSFRTKPFVEGSSVLEPAINLSFTVRARRISNETPVQETLLSQAPRTIKLISNLQFSPYSVYGIGPFTNAGPHPPRVDEETTYTLIWNIKNTTNDVDRVQVQGELPVYVKWLGKTEPENEDLSYNPNTHLVTWKVGGVPASTGVQRPAREVAFQISLIPSVTQEGEELEIVKNLSIGGIDQFTGDVIQHRMAPLTTTIQYDPYFPGVSGKVVK